MRISHVFFFLLSFTLCLIAHKSIAQDSDSSDDEASNIKTTEVTDKDRLDYILNNFRSQLKRVGDSSITTCDHVIEFVNTDIGGKDVSFGASCTISNKGKKLSVLMCNDDMIGKFTFGWPADYPRTPEGITHFIQNNCQPGG